MRTLLLQLPLTPAGPTALYGQALLDTAAPEQRVQRSDTPLALLPQAARHTEVVAMVPAAALSWHRVTLPSGLSRSASRLQAALHGLLEESLLQDVQQLHLALPPVWNAATPTWVAACDRAWLQGHLQALDAAQLTVQRIVPEFAPPEEGQQWHALGDSTDGWLWCADALHGVHGWPVRASAQLPSAWLAGAPVQAEPALVQWVQDHLQTPAVLTDTAAHWTPALRGAWDLAQFELQSDARTRGLQRLRRGLDALLRQPRWQAARWGVLALVLTQIVGLNVWAWQTRQGWAQQQEHWQTLLQDTFPHVKLVLDAPLQMEREVARLRQSSGQLGQNDLEALLGALGEALPGDAAAPARLTYQDGQLQMSALALSASQQAALVQSLQSQGYLLSTEGDTWRLRPRETQP